MSADNVGLGDGSVRAQIMVVGLSWMGIYFVDYFTQKQHYIFNNIYQQVRHWKRERGLFYLWNMPWPRGNGAYLESSAVLKWGAFATRNSCHIEHVVGVQLELAISIAN